jgi:hypothetical protein
MITNTRLQELRTTGLLCQKIVDQKKPTLLEKDFAELFQICLDNLPNHYLCEGGSNVSSQSMGPHLRVLLGK